MKLTSKQQKIIIEEVKKLFTEFNSGSFCGCYEGDLLGEYPEGSREFIELLAERLKGNNGTNP